MIRAWHLFKADEYAPAIWRFKHFMRVSNQLVEQTHINIHRAYTSLIISRIKLSPIARGSLSAYSTTLYTSLRYFYPSLPRDLAREHVTSRCAARRCQISASRNAFIKLVHQKISADHDLNIFKNKTEVQKHYCYQLLNKPNFFSILIHIPSEV